MDDPTKYTKDASTLEKNYYLKHVLDRDNKVTELYACAIFNNKEYCIRGGDSSFYGYAENENDYTDNLLILKRIKDEKIEGISCSFNTDDSYRGDDYGNLDADSYGSAIAGNDDCGCSINDVGSSVCFGCYE